MYYYIIYRKLFSQYVKELKQCGNVQIKNVQMTLLM